MQETKLSLIRQSVSYSSDNTTNNLYVTLPELSLLNEKDIKPFWNDKCDVVQSMLWIPHVVGDNANYQDEPNFWMKRIVPKTKSFDKLSVELPKTSLIDQKINFLEGAKIIATKKIRFYPENEKAYLEALALYRRSYNLAVERFKNGSYKDEAGKSKDIRPEIREIVKQEQKDNGCAYNSQISDDAVREANTTFSTVCSRNKKLKGAKSGFSEMSFKTRKGTKHSFKMGRLPLCLSPYVRVLGKIHLTECVPNEAILKTAVVTCDKGRWFIQVQKHIELKTEIQGKVKCVSIDPGVRTFATCFSEDDSLIVGDNFAKEKLFPLMKRVDALISKKTKLLNLKDGDMSMPIWWHQRLVNVEQQINRLKCKKDDLISDLHNRLAYYLVSNYDVIFLPTFETQKMVSRKGSKTRTIRRNTCRQMLDLNHYNFKMKLKWYAKKCGKHVVDCNESYTSKTRSWDGSIDEKLGSSKVIRGDNFIVDRDINGARNILIKHLTR